MFLAKKRGLECSIEETLRSPSNARHAQFMPCLLLTTLLLLAPLFAPIAHAADSPKTTVSIEGEKFFINGQPTYAGRTWKGKRSRASS